MTENDNEWISLPTENDWNGSWFDYENACDDNCLVRFDDGSECRYNDKEWDTGIITHYKKV